MTLIEDSITEPDVLLVFILASPFSPITAMRIPIHGAK